MIKHFNEMETRFRLKVTEHFYKTIKHFRKMDDWFYDEGEAREEVEAKVGIKNPFLISSPNEKGISGFSFGQQKSHFHDSEPR